MYGSRRGPRMCDRGDEWKWGENPFVNTLIQGLKVMMLLVNTGHHRFQ